MFASANGIAEQDNKFIEEEESRRYNPACGTIASIFTQIAREEHLLATGNDWDQWTLDYIYLQHYNSCMNGN